MERKVMIFFHKKGLRATLFKKYHVHLPHVYNKE